MFKLFLFLLMLIFVAIYFIPSFVAIARKHVHVLQITILNAFLGWSFIAWVAALIWATMNKTDEDVETKASWIIIAVFFFLSIFPLLFISMITDEFKSNSIIETQYKKVIYSTPKGTVKEELKTQQVK